MGILGATLLVLSAATCIWVGTAIGERYPLSRAASTTSIAGWGMEIVLGLAAFVYLGSALIENLVPGRTKRISAIPGADGMSRWIWRVCA